MQINQRALKLAARTIKTLVLSALTVMTCSLFLWAGTTEAVPYPTGFLKWTHIKKESMPAQDSEGKTVSYHIYANEKAVEGYHNKYTVN